MSLIASLDQIAGLLVDAARLSLYGSVLGGGKQKQFLYTHLWKKNKNVWVGNQSEFPFLYHVHQTNQCSNKDMSREERIPWPISLSEETSGQEHLLQLALMWVSLSDWPVAQRASSWLYWGDSLKCSTDILMSHLWLLWGQPDDFSFQRAFISIAFPERKLYTKKKSHKSTGKSGVYM